MTPAAPETPAAGGARVYRRSLATRLVALVCAILLVAAAASYLAGSGVTPWFGVLAGLALLSLCNLVTAAADRFAIGRDGIVYSNRVLELLGHKPRRVGWDDVTEVREHRGLRASGARERPSVLFLRLRSGRPLVLDSLERLDEVLRLVKSGCGAERFRA